MDAVLRLERGEVVEPGRGFALTDDELELLDPALSNGRSKNISLDPGGALGGLAADGERRDRVGRMMRRFADWSQDLLDELAPAYATRLTRARTSFRPCPVEQRPQTSRKDDRRLHIDAFPSQPTQGRRILRVFANVDPEGRPRAWRLGEPFEAFAGRFHRRIARQPPGQAWALQALGLTKGRRAAYDHAMLALHDLAKLDDDYQRTAPRREAAYSSGASWVVFTDAALHAAMGGQHALEQTFLLPIEAMADPAGSPLRTLEQLMARRLV
jgi:hypothetical protein